MIFGELDARVCMNFACRRPTSHVVARDRGVQAVRIGGAVRVRGRFFLNVCFLHPFTPFAPALPSMFENDELVLVSHIWYLSPLRKTAGRASMDASLKQK